MPACGRRTGTNRSPSSSRKRTDRQHPSPLWRGQASRSAGDSVAASGEAALSMVAFLATDPSEGLQRAVHESPRVRSRRLPRTVRVVVADNGTVVCKHCEVADRTLARMRGLLGRSGLGPDEGMLITPA